MAKICAARLMANQASLLKISSACLPVANRAAVEIVLVIDMPEMGHWVSEANEGIEIDDVLVGQQSLFAAPTQRVSELDSRRQFIQQTAVKESREQILDEALAQQNRGDIVAVNE